MTSRQPSFIPRRSPLFGAHTPLAWAAMSPQPYAPNLLRLVFLTILIIFVSYKSVFQSARLQRYPSRCSTSAFDLERTHLGIIRWYLKECRVGLAESERGNLVEC